MEKVDYQQIKPSLRLGDLIFCSGKYEFSRIIQKISDSPYSHIGILVPWNNRVYIMESVEDDGVRMQPVSNYLVNYENSGRPYKGEVFIGRHNNFPTDTATALKIIGIGTDLLNCKYDMDALLRIAARVIFGGKKKILNKEFICSEFVEECFKPSGIKFQNKNGYVLPADIATDPDVNIMYKIQ